MYTVCVGACYINLCSIKIHSTPHLEVNVSGMWVCMYSAMDENHLSKGITKEACTFRYVQSNFFQCPWIIRLPGLKDQLKAQSAFVPLSYSHSTGDCEASMSSEVEHANPAQRLNVDANQVHIGTVRK